MCKLKKDAINNEQLIDEDLFDKLCDAMLERLKDINSRVQIQAIAAIFRLQDPADRNCRVVQGKQKLPLSTNKITTYLFHFSSSFTISNDTRSTLASSFSSIIPNCIL